MPMCDGKIDNWEHLIECKFYDTKWNHEWSSEEEIAKFLVKISRERMIKVKMPLFYKVIRKQIQSFMYTKYPRSSKVLLVK